MTELDYLGKGLNKRCYLVITLRRSIITVALNRSDFYGSDQTQASKNKGDKIICLLNHDCGESQSFINSQGSNEESDSI